MAERTSHDPLAENPNSPMDALDAAEDSMDEHAAEDLDEADASTSNAFADADESTTDDWEGEEADGFAGEDSQALGSDDLDWGDGETFDDAQDTDELLETAVCDALDAADSDEFFRALLGGLGRVAGVMGRGAAGARRVAGAVGRGAAGVRRAAQAVGRGAAQAQRVAGQVGRGAARVGEVARRANTIATRASRATNPLASVIGQLLPLLQQYASSGATEADAFDELSDLYVEDGLDEALPVLAGIAARRLVVPMLARGARSLARPLARQMLQSATRAARTLVNTQGRQAVRALPAIARNVARRAVRTATRPAALPQTLVRAATQVAARPELVSRLSRPQAGAVHARTGRVFQINGPVEITIRRL